MSEPETVTLRREAHNAMKREHEAALIRAEDLRKELEIERGKTPDQRLADCAALLMALKEIADHACANLSPEFIRDLPAEAFATAADHVGSVLSATQRDVERAGVWAERATLIQEWRDKRKARGWGEDAPPKPAKRAWWRFWG